MTEIIEAIKMTPNEIEHMDYDEILILKKLINSEIKRRINLGRGD